MQVDKRKLRQRLSMLEDAIDLMARTTCRWSECSGPAAPIRGLKTCTRCRLLHIAVRAGLLEMTIDRGFRDVEGAFEPESLAPRKKVTHESSRQQ